MSRDPKAFDCGLSRRDVLGLGAAAGASALALSWLGPLSRSARAAVRPEAPARRLLILNCYGAIRSSAAFYASPGSVEHNPWGVIEGTGTPFALGKLLDDFLTQATPSGQPETPLGDDAYQLAPGGGWRGAQVPRLREIADRFSVLGTWNENRGDHIRSRLEEATGAPAAEAGLLTRVYYGLREAVAGRGLDVPGFHIEPQAAFGQAPGTLARYAPVRMNGTSSLPSASTLSPEARQAIGHDWASGEAMRDRLDERRLARRAGFARGLVEVFRSHRQANRRVGSRLAEPWVNVDGLDPAFQQAAQGTVRLPSDIEVPLTNAMLSELFLRALGPEGAGAPGQAQTSPYYNAAVNAGLAVRLLQLGSPAAVVEIGSFDLHSGERQEGPRLYRFLGRLWASLYFLLSRMPDPDGGPGSLLDSTLVLTMSDFGRDPGRANGFNAGDGSDHGTAPSCYYLAHAVMGAGVPGGRMVGPAPNDTFDARLSDERYSHRQLLATLLWALGLDHGNPEWGFADVPDPILALWPT